MTIKEMHIEIRNQMQRLSANRNRKLNEDQIDWLLNSTQQSLVSSALEPVIGSGRHQIKPHKYNIVESLIASRKVLPATWVTDRYISMLPPDFWYLLDDGSSVRQLCTGDAKITSYQVLNITRVQFPLSTLSANYYSNVEVLYNNSSVFNINSLLQQRQKPWTGYPSKEAHFYVKDLIIEQLTAQGITVYWEEFYNNIFPYHLIFVSSSTPVPISIKVDGQTYNGINQELTTELHSSTRSSTLVPNSMMSSDRHIATSATPFFRTSYISPLTEKGPGVIYTYEDGSFIVYNTIINYVRKPRMMSLSLGTECQLSPTVHQLLCNNTVEMAMNRISDPAWKEVTEQNIIMNNS